MSAFPFSPFPSFRHPRNKLIPWAVGEEGNDMKYALIALLLFLAFTLAATFPGVAYKVLAMMGVGNG